ncbi:glycosyltransferase family 2 protein [Rhizobium sp.]|uniref:glycosyltransferase family 2 protein n=1 Tax=Rhizobium sp. TaxID=391 RepID=UPI0028AB9F36
MLDVSLIVPAFNTEQYIHKCIQSALTQDVQLELILINDGSSDATGRICDHYALNDTRIQVVHQENCGQGVARNNALELAKGRYIYFLDSDDYLYPNALRVLRDVSDQNGLDICAPASPGHYYERPFEYISCLPSRMQFVRRSLLERHTIRQPLSRSGQDGVFSHEVLCFAENFGVAQKARLHYRPDRPGSTFSYFKSKPDLVKKIVSSHYEHLSKRYLNEDHAFLNRNAVRLLSFINDETLKNRLFPHIRYLTADDVSEIVLIFRELGISCLERLSKGQRANIAPAVIACLHRDPHDAAKILREDYSQLDFMSPLSGQKNVRLRDEKVVVCKPLAQKHGSPKKFSAPSPSVDTLKVQADYTINVLNHTYLMQRAAFLWQNGNPGAVKPDAPIVSMTTIPSRLSTLHYSLLSIATQTIRPKKILVWLDERVDFQINDYPYLRKISEFGVEFMQVPDIGPHTKLFYSLKEKLDGPIVTFDDDMIYPDTALETLYNGHLSHPNCVVANWARAIPPESELLKGGIRSGRLLTPPLLEQQLEENDRYQSYPTLGALAYGTGGVLYPTGCFDSQVTDLKLMRELCPTEDDVWYRAMAIKAGSKIAPTNLGINPRHFSVVASQATALRHINHGGNGNIAQTINTFRYFRLFDLLNRSEWG